MGIGAAHLQRGGAEGHAVLGADLLDRNRPLDDLGRRVAVHVRALGRVAGQDAGGEGPPDDDPDTSLGAEIEQAVAVRGKVEQRVDVGHEEEVDRSLGGEVGELAGIELVELAHVRRAEGVATQFPLVRIHPRAECGDGAAGPQLLESAEAARGEVRVVLVHGQTLRVGALREARAAPA